MSPTKKEPKYRPSFTATEISYMIAVFKAHQPLGLADIAIVAKLSPFLAKIESATLTPSYVPSPRVSPYSLEGLGGMTREPQDDGLRKEIRWQQAYELYKKDPASCNAVQLADAREHMYLNELMTPEEVARYEKETH